MGRKDEGPGVSGSQAAGSDAVPGTPADVEGRRVLITGASSGLGLAMAEALCRAGAQVAITGRNEERLREAEGRLVAQARARGWPEGNVLASRMDVRDERSVRESVAALSRAFDGIDLLVNNAGIGMRTVNPRFQVEPKPFWTVPPDKFADVMVTNVLGYFLVARAVVPAMVARGQGKIVNVTINRSTMTRPGFTPYGPSRAASEALSMIMCRDLAGLGVTVNLLLPGGATLTGMIPEEVRDELQGTLLDPAVMGPPAVWLASSASDGVTGERISAVTFAEDLARFHETGHFS